MKVLIQWATSTPLDWVEYDIRSSRDVEALPRKPVPDGTEAIDDEPGWITAINIQGVVFLGMDHVAIDVVAGTLMVRTWNDDPEDHDGAFIGQLWTFKDPAPDPSIGGRMNTRQTVEWYATPGSLPERNGILDLKPWAHFQHGAPQRTWHGVWLEDAHFEQHRSRQAVRGWHEWVTHG